MTPAKEGKRIPLAGSDPKPRTGIFLLSMNRGHTAILDDTFRSVSSLMKSLLQKITFLLALGGLPGLASADLSEYWDGIWAAEQGEFVVRVIRDGDRFSVFPVAPMGVPWTSQEGFISGQSATVTAQFQGARGTILIQLTGPDSAIARPLECQPDYHFVCTLARNQQATFVRSEIAD